MIYVKCNSHAARRRLFFRIGERKGFFSMKRETGKGGCYPLHDHEIDAALPCKGVTMLKGPYDDLMQCWDLGYR